MTKKSIKSFIIKRRIDIIVIASLLLLSIFALLLVNLTKKEGAKIRVEIDGKSVGEYSLSEDREYVLNDGSNIITVKDGKAYMSYSDCQGKDCVNAHAINSVGESIICLPNRVSVTVIGESGESVDIVSY